LYIFVYFTLHSGNLVYRWPIIISGSVKHFTFLFDYNLIIDLNLQGIKCKVGKNVKCLTEPEIMIGHLKTKLLECNVKYTKIYENSK